MSSASPSVSLESFAAKLAASQLIPSEKWNEVKGKVLEASDAKAAALLLLSQGLVSRWQASQLLKGNTSLTLGRYRLLDQLGQSVFGKVYLAEHTQLARKLTLFAFAPRLLRGEVREGLMAKARSAAGLDHASILRVSDIDHEGEQYYFVSPEIAVMDVAGYVAKNGALPGPKAASLAATVAEALAYAAQNQVSHGWLCPSNVIFDSKGRPFVVGFGFADVVSKYPEIESQLVAQASEAERLSIPPDSEGTIRPSPSTDAYGLGQLLFLLATGKSPSRDELGDPDAKEQINSANPKVLPAIADLYEELTRPDVSRRLTGANLIAERLQAIAGTAAPATEPPPLPPSASQAVPTIKSSKGTKPGKPVSKASSAGTKAVAVVDLSSVESGELKLAEVEPAPASGSFQISKDSTAGKGAASPAPSKNEAKHEPASHDHHHGRRRKTSSKAAMWMFIAAGTCLLALFGIVGGIIWATTKPPPVVAKNTKTPPKTKDDKTDTSLPGAAATPEAQTDPAKAKADGPTADAAKNDASKTDPTKTEAAKAGPGPGPNVAKPEDPKNLIEPMPEPEKMEPKADPASDDPVMEKPGEKTAPTPEPMPAPTTNPEAPPANPPAPTPPPPATPGGPLGKLAKTFELEPPSDENAGKAVEIGDLVLPPNGFATAMLIGGDAAVKGAYQFNIEDKADNDWNVKLAAQKEKTETVIANLAVTDGKLKFKWTPEAVKEPAAVGLRNCVLQLSAAGSQPHQMALRTPVEFDTASPADQKTSISRQIELTHLPPVERLRLQIIPNKEALPNADVSFNTKGAGKGKQAEAKAENELRPAVVWSGSSPQVKAFGFEVKPEIKGKGLSISTVAIVRGPEEVSQNSYTAFVLKKVQTAVKQLTGSVELVRNRRTQVDGSQAAPGQDPNQFKTQKEQQIQALDKSLGDQSQLLSWLSDAESTSQKALSGTSLEFRLYYDAGGAQVDIARSRGFVAPAKAEKK